MIRVVERVYKRVLNTPKNGKTREGAMSDGTLELLKEWAGAGAGPVAGWVRVSLGEDGHAAVAGQPVAAAHAAEAGEDRLGLGDVSGAAQDQRQPVEEGGRRSEGCLRPEGPRTRRQHGGLHQFGHGAEASRTQETRSRRASKTATATAVRIGEVGLME